MRLPLFWGLRVIVWQVLISVIDMLCYRCLCMLYMYTCVIQSRYHGRCRSQCMCYSRSKQLLKINRGPLATLSPTPSCARRHSTRRRTGRLSCTTSWKSDASLTPARIPTAPEWSSAPPSSTQYPCRWCSGGTTAIARIKSLYTRSSIVLKNLLRKGFYDVLVLVFKGVECVHDRMGVYRPSATSPPPSLVFLF